MCAAVLVAALTAIERPQLYLLVVLFLLAAMAWAGLPGTLPRRDLAAATATFGLFLAALEAHSVWLFSSWGNREYNSPLFAYRAFGGLVDTIQMVVPATVIVCLVTATVISGRRPGWAAAIFPISVTWALMPLAELIRYDRWRWENPQVTGGFLLVLSAVSLAAGLDLSRAAGPRGPGEPHPPAAGRDIATNE
ncbi:hypothetical protein [Frankia sp. AgKG'84/4]|uniref:hypothetical protein n=1 Tax=Frankia sp. AgKG'84/4 TaxID=573490 RepID=UPI00200E3D22|nr:hypothetical protein [Frankia sp. AgKG'84/4]MCL9794088.1 hypothetical protein [Frankia sp. AgKG'84/4]